MIADMGRRVVVDRLDEGSVAPVAGETRQIGAPDLTAIRIVFGVGKRPDTAPDEASFKPVYTVNMPVFSLGGLDPDGIYEFGANRMLESLQDRARRRRWACRLELEVAQPADSVSAADLYAEAPFEDDGPGFSVGGRNPQGATGAGGGRNVVLKTGLVHDEAGVTALGGTYTLQLRDADPRGDAGASVESPVREVNVRLTNYEFEG